MTTRGIVFAIALVTAALLVLPTSAHAQVSGSLSLQNDDRFRGRSVSNGEPVAIATIVYDHESGISASGSAVMTSNGPDVGPLRASGHIGYAKAIGHNLAIDGGAVLHVYTDRYSSGREQTFAEFYGGVTLGDVAVHASYSPSYLDQGLQTLYLEFNAVRDLGSGFRVNAHAGVLARLSGNGSLGGANARHDISLGLIKDFDRVSASVVVGTAGSGEGRYFSGFWQGRNSIVIALSRSF